MKKILITLSVAISLMSCDDPKRIAPVPSTHKLELSNGSKYYDQNYNIYTLEGCEYIVVGVGQTRWGSHKGNCKNPIHRYYAR